MASLASRDSALARSEALFARSYGICVISFGVVHVVYFSGLPAWVPKWIPPGQVFWAVTTTVCFFLAAAAILSGIVSVLRQFLSWCGLSDSVQGRRSLGLAST